MATAALDPEPAAGLAASRRQPELARGIRCALRRGATALGMGRLCLDPVDVEVALGEQPGPVALDEGVAIAKVGQHQLALASLGEQVMGDAVALAGRPVAVQ